MIRFLLTLLALPLCAVSSRPPGPAGLPPIVFVSRQPVAGEPLAIPGLGPRHRAAAHGGRLLIRDRDGRVRDLLENAALFDVSDPAVAPDGRHIAFAGTTHADSAWRLYEIASDGRGLRQLTFSDRDIDLSRFRAAAGDFARYDDLDPCWIGEGLLCFSSTRYPQRSEYDDRPATNLFQLDTRAAHSAPRRLTAERNGAEEPAWEPRSGRIVYSRWWFNRHRAAERGDPGWTDDAARAVASDSVNLWQAISITPEGTDARLAGGEPITRRGTMAYQVAPLADGSLAVVYASNLGLSPSPVATGIQVLSARFAASRRVIGAIVPDRGGDPYAGARGLAAPSACAPAALPDGRLLFSYAPGGRGDFGIYVARPVDSEPALVVDMPGALELDAVPLLPWRRPRASRIKPPLRTATLPAFDLADTVGRGTFRFQCLNLFANGPLDHPVADAPPVVSGARIRFLAALARPDRAGGDTVVLLREVPIGDDGRVDEAGLPADFPLFEQVVDRNGRLLMSAHGPAHVAGFNSGTTGGTSRCVGCHAGHSTLLRDLPQADPAWFNAATSARVEVSSSAPGFNSRALVDRRTRGAAQQVAWMPSETAGATVRLAWDRPIEVREVVIHAIRRDSGAESGAVPHGCTLSLLFEGREVGRRVSRSRPSPRGLRFAFAPIRVDAVEVVVGPGARDARASRPGAGLAEIVTIARL